MNSPNDQSYWNDDVVIKRGTAGKDAHALSPSKIRSSLTDLLLPISTSSQSKSGLVNHTSYSSELRLQHGMRKGHILAIVYFLSIFALSNSFLSSRPSRQSTELGGLNNALLSPVAAGSARELDVSDGTGTSELGSLAGGGYLLTPMPRSATLKVFMYDLPSEFHFGMMDNFEPSPDTLNVWPRNLSDLPKYPAGLHQQYSPEYWLTVDVLASNEPGRNHECTAVRVKSAEEADVIFVPFFAALSYNRYTKKMQKDGELDRNVELQEKLVKYLQNQRPWQESAGRDHVIVNHHPNGMHKVRERLKSAMYVVSDFGRFSEEVANVRKDIVAPYRHVISSFKNDDSTFDSRTILLFFQGAMVRKEGGVLRQQLIDLLKEEEGVHFAPGIADSKGVRSATLGMRKSKFCLHLAGDTPSSNRLFDAIASHCVPVVIIDKIELPYEEELDYSKFCLFIRSIDALKKGFVTKLLRGIQEEEWTKMWVRLQEVAIHFEYQHPTEPTDAVNMLWKAIARKAVSVNYSLHKHRRYARSSWPQLL